MATFVAVLAPTPVQATYGQKAKRQLTVMSRNIYLGASLTPAIAAQTPDEFAAALGGILGEFQATNYEARSGALANEILATGPDLIGLQEVSIWTFVTPDGTITVDFLEILQFQLAGRGLSYSVVAVADNANIGPLPVGENLIRFQDRDVILKNDATEGLEITGSDSGRYEAQQLLPTPLGVLSFDRGWAYVDGKYQGRKFRFINTHLETEDFADVQEAQAAEFLRGPARKRGTVIAVGDFNSAADGSTTDTYRMLTKRWQFRDAWRGKSRNQGLTCCFDSALADSSSELSSRIDLVLVKGWAWARPASVIGDEPFQDSAPYWASDHAGVVATIRLF
jgi:endonuclease/exonuclease/phosphatase family metal-dependent hydrolase